MTKETISLVESKKESNNMKKYFLYFTFIFLAMVLLVFGWYFLCGRTLIWSASENINNSWDGYSQHYRALLYYSKYLRGIVKNIFINHQFIIPNWNFSLGEGADIVGILNYYVIGDPFTFLSTLVPVRFMWIYYDLMILLRIYFSGVFFSILCFKTKKNNKYAILSGALTYMFCLWAIYNANRHPYFLNPMVYFPLIILGVEKIIKNERPYLLIGMVFLSAISNFYFFYSIAILTAVYTLVRLIILYKKDIKTIMLNLVKIGVYAIVGVLLSSIVFLPVCYTFLLDARMSLENVWSFVYPLRHYSVLPAIFLTNESSYWLFMGYSAPTILAIFMMFRKKHDNNLFKILILICLIITLVPIFGQVLNGFSYMCNRWCWALALLVAYILVLQWDNLLNIDENNWKWLSIYLTIYTFICILFTYSKESDVFIAICLAFCTLFLICPLFNKENKREKIEKMFLGIIIISIVVNGILENSINGKNYASEALEINNLTQNSKRDEAVAVKEFAKKQKKDIKQFRFSGRNLTKNANLTEGISSTQYFWTNSNSYITDFRSSLGLREDLVHLYEGYDDRTFLNTLSSVRYFVTGESDSNYVPYDFKLKKIIDKSNKNNDLKYKIYENKNYLPLVYTYNNYINKKEWDKLNALDKQEALLQAAVVDKNLNTIEIKNISYSNIDIPYSIKCNDEGIAYENNKFEVKSTNSTVTINFEGIKNSETYIDIKGLDFIPTNTYKLLLEDKNNKDVFNSLSISKRVQLKKDNKYWIKPSNAILLFNTNNGISKSLNYNNKENMYYIGRHDFCINCNYSEEPMSSITIRFLNIGTYTFDSLKINCQPMNEYREQVNKLKEDELEEINIDVDKVNCRVTVDEPKIAVFAIPYSKGWEAYVDGKKTEITQVNIKNFGVVIDKGTHYIELHYHTPLMKQGMYISFSTLLCLCMFCIIYEKKKETTNHNKSSI